MRRITALTVMALTVSIAALSAQKMSGAYTINPGGSGPRNFKTFLEAGKNLFFFGVSGPVDIKVSPGIYKESFFLLPTQGASAKNRITFSSLNPLKNSVKIQGSGNTITMFSGISNLPNGWITLDGLTFDTGNTAISAGERTSDVEIKNCVFNKHTPLRAVIDVNGVNTNTKWSVHHNTFVGASSRTIIYGSQITNWEIHSNEFDLNNAQYGIYLINNSRARNRIYNNLFYGAVRSSAIFVAANNINNDVSHNTLHITTTSNNASGIATFGTSSNLNRIYGNVISVVGPGMGLHVTFANTLANWRSDGNLFFVPQGNVGGISNTRYKTLKSWRANGNTNQPERDQKSIAGDPLFVDATANPPDLHVKGGSPVKDKAVNTPAWNIEDFEGRIRDANPDIGAYELSGFGLFAKGCAGAGKHVPILSSTGLIGIGKTFQVKLSKALGGAAGVLVLGASHKRWNSIPLPFATGGGCDLLVGLDLTFAVSVQGVGPGNGTASLPSPVPNDKKLEGMSFNLQWLILDGASASAFGFAMSNGGSANL